ncbi:MAG: complex I NDUFA9 subunit family protein [Alphaproteobacteria bacterium]|nr:complex I NDUFA9 subunit family protein [Alphaproteobacteria bacterium]
MSCRRVTVFGGTGFLGRCIVRHLQNADFAVRIVSRHPDRGRSLFSRDVSGIEPFSADVNNDGSVASAVSGAWAVVNAVSLYVEHEQRTFQSVHVEAARRVAMLARRAGVEALVHISGIGADAGSASPYIRSRGSGEAAVLDAFPSAKLVRPAVMFGPCDAFLRPLLTMLRHMPVFPMFGSGQTRLQPAYVEDVAEGIVRILRAPAARQLYELAGPRVYTYQELLRTIATSAGTRPFLVRFPFSLWHVIGLVSETLSRPPITRNQVELMEKDNIPEPDAPGFEALQISPQAIENILPQMLQAAREKSEA